MTTVTVKSKTTGLVGNYPISHVDLDPDLEIVSPDEDPIETPTRKGKNK